MSQNSKVALYTLGCKLNFSETSTISRQFQEAGYVKVSFDEWSNVYIINTCSVTDNADKKCKGLVKKAKQINPLSKVIIIGCYAQLKPEEINQIEGVDLVLGANEKFDIISYIEKSESEQKTIYQQSIKNTTLFQPSFSAGDRTRSFFKIQDGCDYFCTFCTIPLARGKSRNASIEQTFLEAQKIAETACKEMVLTGVNIGDFGQKSNEDFYQLIQQLDELNGIERIRISSIEPNLLNEDIIRFCLLKSKKFMPHFHIPLQSGQDRLLNAMRRKYDTSLFKQRIELIHSISPDSCIGIDVIVGFPGESDDDFEETVRFIQSLNVHYLHVFTYSERDNTSAIKMENPVSMEKRKERSKRLHILSEKLKRQFYENQKGKVKKVLFEQENDSDKMYGFTDNYIKVITTYSLELSNKIVDVKLTQINSEGLMKCELIGMEERL
ncbi:MAG: tRNA (N(6)-L-threonylcarbamoyladenosine(37)-C(2))-methylthiotransferase MtaB [Flavobacteriia bacterium]|nr:tRNA (N(6)-L-threonylcarbamoyladenosine(37)-C(2))-methylthiotransferase MtaB [Flavobacteriia bacterium]